MKKLQLLLVALALVSFTALVSCGNAKEKPAEATEEVVEEAQPEIPAENAQPEEAPAAPLADQPADLPSEGGASVEGPEAPAAPEQPQSM